MIVTSQRSLTVGNWRCERQSGCCFLTRIGDTIQHSHSAGKLVCVSSSIFRSLIHSGNRARRVLSPKTITYRRRASNTGVLRVHLAHEYLRVRVTRESLASWTIRVTHLRHVRIRSEPNRRSFSSSFSQVASNSHTLFAHLRSLTSTE